MSKKQPQQPRPRPRPRPGKPGSQVQACGLPDCTSVQDVRYMGDVMVIVQSAEGYEIGQAKACRRHVAAFGAVLPSLKKVLDAAYEGQSVSVRTVPVVQQAPGEPGL